MKSGMHIARLVIPTVLLVATSQADAKEFYVGEPVVPREGAVRIGAEIGLIKAGHSRE